MARRYKLDPIRSRKGPRRQSQIYDDLFGGPIEPLDLEPANPSETPDVETAPGGSLGRGGGSGGPDPTGPGGYGTSGPASSTPSVVNYGNKTNIDTPLGKVSVRDLALSPFGTTGKNVIGGVADALAGTLGPYGVVGGPQAPQVGTRAFAQQTPALDTAPGVPDPGAQAASMSSTNAPAGVAGPVSAGLGGTASNPSVPGSFGGGGSGNAGASVSSAGHNAAGAATSDVGTTSAGVAGNVGAGNMGGGGRDGGGGNDGGGPGGGPGGTSGTGMGGSAGGGVL
jgi:hypothetical protein